MSENHFRYTMSYTTQLFDQLERHCLPVLLCAMEALNVKDIQLKEMKSWWNAAYRKICGFNKYVC